MHVPTDEFERKSLDHSIVAKLGRPNLVSTKADH